MDEIRSTIIRAEAFIATYEFRDRAVKVGLSTCFVCLFVLGALLWEAAERRVATVMQEEITWQK